MELKISKPGRYKSIYEVFMMLLALLAVGMLLYEFSFSVPETTAAMISHIDTVVLIIFAADYFVRFFTASRKGKFIKENIPDLIAIIPFSSVFRIARLARLTRLLRFTRLAKMTRALRIFIWLRRFREKLLTFIRTNGFIYVLAITIVITIIGTIGIYLLEGMKLTDALWWSFVTITTVGYGDVSPVTGGGRILAGLLMLAGIGFIGMLTGTIATFFLKPTENKREYRDRSIENIVGQLKNFDDLSKEEVRDICKTLIGLKEDIY